MFLERLANACVQSPALRTLLLPANPLADHLPSPLSLLASSPRGAVLVACGGYAVFLVLFAPLRLLAVVLGEQGTYVALATGIWFFGNLVASYLSFPGSFKSVQRDIERDYSRRLVQKLEGATLSLAAWAQDLRGSNHHQYNGNASSSSSSSLDPSAFAQRHGEAQWFKVEVVDTLKEALELIGISSSSTSSSLGLEGRAAAVGAGPSVKSRLNQGAVAEALTLHRLLSEAQELVNLLWPSSSHLINAPSMRDFRQRHAAFRSSSFEQSEGRGSGAAAAGNGASSSSLQTPAQAAESLLVVLGRLRLLAPRLRLRLGKSEAAGGPFGWIASLRDAKQPIADSIASLDLMRGEVLARFHAKCFYLRFASHLVDVCVVPASPPSSGVDHDDVSDDLSPMHGGGSHNSGNTEPLVVGSKDENPDTGTAASLSSSSWFTQGNVQVPTIRRGVVQRGQPAVVFCNPNAGLYECANSSPKSADWLDFYRGLGFQVILFNYRGYGRSTGTPTPSRNCDDLAALIRALKLQAGVSRLALHGESIGGLCACQAAAHPTCKDLVDLLIVDRTFANLGAVAQYLVGGWTVPGLRLFACGWNTDVASAYWRAPVQAKVLASDVDDAIIAEPGSLKSGLALYLELGDPAAIKPSLPHEYNLAEYLNEPPPRHSAPRLPSLPPLEVARATAHDDARGGGGGATSVDAANDDGLMTSPKLTEAMVVHFAQSLRRVARRAKESTNRKPSSVSSTSANAAKTTTLPPPPSTSIVLPPPEAYASAELLSRYSVKELKAAAAAQGLHLAGCTEKSDLVAMLMLGHHHSGTSGGGSSGEVTLLQTVPLSSSPQKQPEGEEQYSTADVLNRTGILAPNSTTAAAAARKDDNDEDMGSDSGLGIDEEEEWDLPVLQNEEDDEDEDVDGDEERGNRGRNGHNGSKNNTSPLRSNTHGFMNQPGGEGSLGSVKPPSSLPLVAQCWWLLARCDGRCGQLLGHATAKGLPWVRAWACSLVVWAGPTTTTCSDNDASSSSSSAGGGGRMVPFRDSVTRLHGCDPVGEDSRFLSVADVSVGLDALLDAGGLGADLHEVRYIAGMMRLLAHRTGGEVSAQQARNARYPNSDLPSLLGSGANGAGGGSGAAAGVHGGLELGVEAIAGSSSSRALGVLIPLRCGHNAAYSQGELKMLRHHVEAVMATWHQMAGEEVCAGGSSLV